MFYRFLADVVAAIHFGYVACVLVGLILILLGGALGWQWVRNRWFRLAHLLMILGVVVRSAFMNVCPLTNWEYQLREWGGQEDFEGSPVGRFFHEMIHPPLPRGVFPIIYISFALLVLSAFWLIPVHWGGDQGERPV